MKREKEDKVIICMQINKIYDRNSFDLLIIHSKHIHTHQQYFDAYIVRFLTIQTYKHNHIIKEIIPQQYGERRKPSRSKTNMAKANEVEAH